MISQFMTVDIDLKDLNTPLQDAVEARLKLQGEPLRWAITAVNRGIARVEAVVLQNLEAPEPSQDRLGILSPNGNQS
jgi:hypothetical protein